MLQRIVFLLPSNCFERKSFCIFSLLLICLASQIGYSQNTQKQRPPETAALEMSKPIEREFAGGRKHDYQIAMSADQYALITVDQRGIDITVRAFGADGKLTAEFDSEISGNGTEKVEVVAVGADNYRLEVEAKLKNAPAGYYEIRVLELRSATEQDKSLQEARTLLAESLRLSRAGKSKEALPLIERASEIREKILGSEDPAVAHLLNRAGIINFSLGNVAQSETLFKRALSIYEKNPGPTDYLVSDPLNNLAVIYRNRGEFIEAEAMLLRALAIREKVLEANHTLIASVYNNLGILYRQRGNNAKAEQMYERSLEIRQRTLGTEHPDLAPLLQNLAALNYYKGDYATAIALDRRVLGIYEKNLEPDHPNIAQALSNLALVLAEGGESEKAEPLYRRALAMREKKFGRDHFNTSATIHNLAKLYAQQGDYAKAKPLFQRTLEIAEKNLESEPLTAAIYFNSLGSFYTLEADYAQAETLLKRALEMREKLLGGEHQEVGRTCGELARLFALKGDLNEAVTFQTRANRINEKNIALNLSIGSEHQKLSYMNLMAEDLNQTIALHALMAQENALARDQAVTAILQRKGRVLDAMTDGLATLRQHFNARDQILIDRLSDTNARLAEFALGELPNKNLAEYKAQLAVIQEQKDKLESEISRRSAGFYESAKPITIDSVQAIIPTGAALVEFAVYHPFDAKKSSGNQTTNGDSRYVAYVIRKQGEAQWKELGAAAEIDKTIAAYRQALRDPKRDDVQKLARLLDQKIMSPVRALAGNATHLLISPDGELNLIPFEALVDEKNRYLIEQYFFTYLTSGRDLLRMQIARTSKSNFLIVANPLFGATKQIVQPTRTTKSTRRRSITATRSLSDTYFAPLGGTVQESRSIQTLFPEATFLIGSQATESALKQTTAPRILHIATHGFFLQDNETSVENDSQAAARNANVKIENPLLRSGLALAGANRHSVAADDGILTALEASGLNLWGTNWLFCQPAIPAWAK